MSFLFMATDKPTKNKKDGSLSALTKMMALSEDVPDDDLFDILQSFTKRFGSKELKSILFAGLHSKSSPQMERIQFLNAKLKELSNQEPLQDHNQWTPTLCGIDADSLVSICQHLAASDLSHLQRCNRSLFQFVQETPAIHAVTTPKKEMVSQSLKLLVRDEIGCEVWCRVNKTTKFRKVFSAYCTT